MRMKIGDLAKLADCKIVTIRYYEKEGLLPEAARSGNNYRLYGEADLERLQFIRRCRAMGMSLEEVRGLLALKEQPDQDCSALNVLLGEHIRSLDEHIASLTQLREHLAELRSRCHGMHPLSDCVIMHGLSEPTFQT